MSNVLVFGTGSVGTIYAYVLSQSGARVTCVCGSNFKQAKAHGFLIRSSIFGHVRFRPEVVESVADACSPERPTYDYIVICAKSSVQQFTCTLVAPAIVESIAIVLIQNGLGVEQEFRTAFPANPIISAVAYLPSTQISPGVVEHKEVEQIHLGTYPSTSVPLEHKSKTQQFSELLKLGGASVILHEDVQIERWNKIVANAAVNPICALSRCRDVEFMEAFFTGEQVVRSIMLEVISVAAAVGYGEHINEQTVNKQLQRSKCRAWPGVEPSMLADVRMEKSMEVEGIVGELVRLAKQNQVRVDKLDLLYALLKGLDASLERNRSQSNMVSES